MSRLYPSMSQSLINDIIQGDLSAGKSEISHVFNEYTHTNNSVSVKHYMCFINSIAQQTNGPVDLLSKGYQELYESSNITVLAVNVVCLSQSHRFSGVCSDVFMFNRLKEILKLHSSNVPIVIHSVLMIAFHLRSDNILTQDKFEQCVNLLQCIIDLYPTISMIYFKSLFIYHVKLNKQHDICDCFILSRVFLAVPGVSEILQQKIIQLGKEYLEYTVNKRSKAREIESSIIRFANNILCFCGPISAHIKTMSEVVVFSHFPSLFRVAGVSFLGRLMGSCCRDYTESADSNRTDDAGHIDSYVGKIIHILLDVVMLDTSDKLRLKALCILDECNVIRMCGNDIAMEIVRVFVFKCRDKSTNIREHAFTILNRLGASYFRDVFDPENLKALTQYLLRMYPLTVCSSIQTKFVVDLVSVCIPRSAVSDPAVVGPILLQLTSGGDLEASNMAILLKQLKSNL
mmetsp:Transcript_2053/g.3215  ORF Transcript_2053/g.3215 Transcript_2053/m.3215 type:complete len:459 (+) Transcript_2053:114-1490(+)